MWKAVTSSNISRDGDFLLSGIIVKAIIKKAETDLVLSPEGGWVEFGGPGSGNKGHKGVKGRKGGSAARGTSIGTMLVEGRSNSLVYKVSDMPMLTKGEENSVRSALKEIDLPPCIGRVSATYTYIAGRNPPKGEDELATTSGSIIFINRGKGTFETPQKLKGVLAHEFGHVVVRNYRVVQTEFENRFGKGPYKSGTFGVTSRYHLQNSSEMFSHLFGKFANKTRVDTGVASFMNEIVYERSLR